MGFEDGVALSMLQIWSTHGLGRNDVVVRPAASPAQQHPIIAYVDKILAAKKANPQADTSAWERAIDGLVYGLYGLTEDEVKVVEGGRVKTAF